MRSHYAMVQRAHTDGQETELARYIASEYIDPRLMYTDANFKIDALQFDQEIVCRIEKETSERELTDEQMREIGSFGASSKFIQAFRARNWLSLRQPSFKRRSKAIREDME
jgi:hypothetical protein